MPRYIVVNSAVRGVGGLMTMPEEPAKMACRRPWMGYIYTKDVDASTQALEDAGGNAAPSARRYSGRRPLRRRCRPAGGRLHVLQPNQPEHRRCRRPR
ncbi:hypothetical protein ACVOMV_21120 [Mesorhizobium atlanticum]